MAVGLGLLGLAPGAFWSMTPAELEAAIRGRFGNVAFETPLSRNDLSDLMRRFPDA
jgi:uncharacterized phage protein (TIGR02216 family)